MCYLNDNCVSLNFKKDPDNNEAVHICELNNARHLKKWQWLDIWCQFLLSWLEGELKIDVSKLSTWNNIKTIINVYANFRVFDHSVLSFFFHSIPPSFFRYFILFYVFSLRTLVIRIPTAKTTQLASLDSQSRDINACVLLDSRENVVKQVWV